MEPLTWQTLDWTALDRLRDQFLDGKPPAASYWTTPGDVANYDFTFARRIGWKWDAVLRELRLRGWTPPPGPLLDWGCGSGVASRRVIEFLGQDRFSALQLFDRSPLAMQFAADRARAAFPAMPVEQMEPRLPIRQTKADGVEPEFGAPGTLVISHVLNELDEAGGKALRSVLEQAGAVLWVEPGTHADSRALIAVRESLRERFLLVAPCPHQAACGLLAPDNARHWCHHFASPPPGLMADGHWVRFAQRAGIDLRRLPYSFLVLERKGAREPATGLLAGDWSRVLGEPRLYKGYARILGCQADGVRELELQKRDAPEVYKAMKSGEGPILLRGPRDQRRFQGLDEVR